MKKALILCICLSLVSIIGINIYAAIGPSSAYCSVECDSGAMITCYSPCSAGDDFVVCNGIKTSCGTEENEEVTHPTQP